MTGTSFAWTGGPAECSVVSVVFLHIVLPLVESHNRLQTVEIRTQIVPLLLMSSGEHHPAVERGRPACAASARLYPYIGSRPFDDIAKPDLLFRDESRQARSMGRAFALVRGVVLVACICHVIHRLALPVSRT